MRVRIRAFFTQMLVFSALATPISATSKNAQVSQRVEPEHLKRGGVAVPAQGGGMLVDWRMLKDDPSGVRFQILRDGKSVHTTKPGEATAWQDLQGTPQSAYAIARVGDHQRPEAAMTWAEGYLPIPISAPAGGVTPSGEAYSYTANDASIGDLDGDGQYEIVLKWDPTNSHDNSQAGYTGPVILDAYRLDGTRLWRINLGRNIRAGAHYTQFLVYDFDGDGRAEVAMKTADGTIDGTGHPIGDAKADWRSTGGEVPQRDRTGARVLADGTMVAPMQGRIVKGPEFLTVFDGRTGKALASAPYDPPRYPGENPTPQQLAASWGDGYANRSDRFLAGVGYLDGHLPSMIFGRGYYGRTAIAAWDWRGGKLTKRWLFDSAAPGDADYGGRGNHQLAIADVDHDGRDEVIYGSMAVDDNGKGLWTQPLLPRRRHARRRPRPCPPRP